MSFDIHICIHTHMCVYIWQYYILYIVVKLCCIATIITKIQTIFLNPKSYIMPLCNNKQCWFLNCINILSHNKNGRRLFNQIDPARTRIEIINKGRLWSQCSHQKPLHATQLYTPGWTSLESLRKMVLIPNFLEWC